MNVDGAELLQIAREVGLREVMFNVSAERATPLLQAFFAAALEAALSAEPAAQGDSAEDRFEQYVATLIAKAPDVQKLGSQLAHWLDDDKFNNVEPILTGIAQELDRLRNTAPPAQPAERVPEGWVMVPREALGYVSDLLAERKRGVSGRSPAHNARIVVDHWLAASPAAPAEEGDGKEGVR